MVYLKFLNSISFFCSYLCMRIYILSHKPGLSMKHLMLWTCLCCWNVEQSQEIGYFIGCWPQSFKEIYVSILDTSLKKCIENIITKIL